MSARSASEYYEIRVEPETLGSTASRQFVASALEIATSNIPIEAVGGRVRLRIVSRKDGSDLAVFDKIEYEVELNTLEESIRDDLQKLGVHEFETKYRNIDPSISPQVQWRRLLAPRTFPKVVWYLLTGKDPKH